MQEALHLLEPPPRHDLIEDVSCALRCFDYYVAVYCACGVKQISGDNNNI